MDLPNLSESQLSSLKNLKACGPEGFHPIGWLYRGVYDELRSYGVVVKTFDGGYKLTELGKAVLKNQEK